MKSGLTSEVKQLSDAINRDNTSPPRRNTLSVNQDVDPGEDRAAVREPTADRPSPLHSPILELRGGGGTCFLDFYLGMLHTSTLKENVNYSETTANIQLSQLIKCSRRETGHSGQSELGSRASYRTLKAE